MIYLSQALEDRIRSLGLNRNQFLDLAVKEALSRAEPLYIQRIIEFNEIVDTIGKEMGPVEFYGVIKGEMIRIEYPFAKGR